MNGSAMSQSWPKSTTNQTVDAANTVNATITTHARFHGIRGNDRSLNINAING